MSESTSSRRRPLAIALIAAGGLTAGLVHHFTPPPEAPPPEAAPLPAPPPREAPVVALPAPDPAASVTSKPVVQPPGKPLARVIRLRGEPEVRLYGEPGWTLLGPRDLLRSGDEVRAEKGTVELSFPGGDPAKTAVDGAARVLLNRGLLVIGPPDRRVSARLVRGECFVASLQAFPILFADTLFEVDGAAEIDANQYGGTLEVHRGRLRHLSGPWRAPHPRYGEGRRVHFTLKEADGPKVYNEAAFKVRIPRWVRRLDLFPVRRKVVFQPGMHDADLYDAYDEQSGTPRLGPPGPYLYQLSSVTALRVARSADKGGLWRHAAGLTIRLRVRIAKAAVLRLQLTNSVTGKALYADSPQVPADRWVELVFHPERFQGVGGPLELAPGDLIRGFELRPLKVTGARLDLNVIKVVRPRSR